MSSKPRFVGEKVRLGDVCELVLGQSPSSNSYNADGIGLPFYQGNADFGKEHPIPRVWCDEPKKIALAGDILISVRAPIGAVNTANETCCIGRGVAAVRSHSETVSQGFLKQQLLARRSLLESMGTGSTFKAVGKKDLLSFPITLYSLQQQMRIKDKLKQVLLSISTCQELIVKLDSLVKSRFVEMFGDPAANSHDLPIERLSDLGALERGKSKHRPRNAPELRGGPDGPYPLVQTGDITNAGLFLSTYKDTYTELGLRQSRMWPKGTLCITIAANIAQTSILAIDACFPDSVVGFTPGPKIQNVFLHYWFGFFQGILEKQAPQAAQKNINLKILSELGVIIPSMEKQQEFADFAARADKSKFVVQQTIDKLQTLYDSLAQEYFGDWED